jgi:predicted esterase
MRALVLALAIAACGNTHLAIDAHCNPLGFAGHCAVPWPSSAFEIADASTPTGRRLAIASDTLPKNFENAPIDPTMWNLADGFSPAAPMLVAFPGGVSAAGLPSLDNFDLSITANSPTALLDMTTGQLVPHFAELDAQGAGTPDSQALFIRPALRLVGGHHYAVAITNLVRTANGGALPAAPGFAALLDGKRTDSALLEAMRPELDTALDALDAAGFPRADLALAWDFTVASDGFLHREMIATRDRALAAIANRPLAFTLVTDQQPDPHNANIARYVTGKLDAPLFLSSPAFGVDGTTTVRDSDGLPVVQGFYQIPFAAIVPACAYTSATPVPMILYGHGLLGDATEVDCCGVPPVAVDLCMVIVGTDMRGMSQQDTAAVASALNDASKSDQVFEVLEQGIANHVVLAHAMRTTLAQTLFVDAAQNNKPLVDPTRVYYWGLSQGAIFGASVMAYEPTITRAVLGSGAANYSFLLDRSADWPQYRMILASAYSDPLDDALLLALMQMRWDKTEPAGIANGVLDGTATGVPAKQLLMQIAFADEQVSDFAAYWEARTMNVPVLSPTVTSPWGLATQSAPQSSGLVIYDCGAPPPPITNTPPPKEACPAAGTSELHDLPAHVAAGRRQMNDFYQSGQIVNECAGACACASGACN